MPTKAKSSQHTDLHRVDILALSTDEKLAFFLNLYNAMVIHAVIRGGRPNGVIDRRSFFSDFQYLVGGNVYSLNIIKNGILRNNRRSPYSLMKPFSNADKRIELALPKVNPLIHFGLCNGTRSSPSVRFNADFGQEKEVLKWIMDYLDATKAGLLTHLLSDGGPVNVAYHNYDWSVNS
ncbi:hypothetical protein CK203_015863 [Vitis vinifera]|uniref:DUF547 domain-containing protein n=1 Tax=Vitis vinifera TaxID=29760 RepID=A0A438JRW7_VITVI|nr:hypothetical protein CK203_015863 [Vitis vinifera]